MFLLPSKNLLTSVDFTPLSFLVTKAKEKESLIYISPTF